ncbi:MAG: hypothetical protein M3Y59_11245 [Myxococcota bacterium]|nr:hypothetical protein [Myxococcota bacterium]
MKRLLKAAVLGACLGGTVAAAGEGMAGKRDMEAKTQKMVEKHQAWLDENVKDWPEKTQGVIATTIDKYGPPHGQTDGMLVWNDIGPWQKTVIFKEEVDHDFPMPHKDVMEQTIAYQVPVDKFDDLAAYDGSVIAERTKGVLSARCDKEAANFLAINLANDVATGKKSVAHARKHYADAIAKLLKGEKPDPYLTGLKFEKKSDTHFTDRVAPQLRQMGIGGSGDEGMDEAKHPSK